MFFTAEYARNGKLYGVTILAEREEAETHAQNLGLENLGVLVYQQTVEDEMVNHLWAEEKKA